MSIEGIVYCFENLVNGKKYVGQTTKRRFDRRMADHRRAPTNHAFHCAIRKYGFDSFVFRILEDDVPTEDALNSMEIYWIKELGTKGENGYNMTSGGEGSRDFEPSIETRKKMSESAKKRKASEETRAKFSAMRQKEKHPRWGYTLTDEEKVVQAISQPKSMPVREVETGLEFLSRTAAARYFNIKAASVCRSIETGRTYEGHQFVRIEKTPPLEGKDMNDRPS